VDAPTDVLSFSQLDAAEYEEEEEEEEEEEAGPGSEEGPQDDLARLQQAGVLLPGGHLLLGDVVLSAPRAAAQAAERGHSLRDELRILLTHGLLHLLGYDHELGPAAAAAMGAEERRVLRALGWASDGLIAAAAAPRRRADVLFLDLDGTLLCSQGRVSAANAAAISAAQAAGVRVIVATGKARPGAMAALAASGLADPAAPLALVGLHTPGVFLQGLAVYGADGVLVASQRLPPPVLAAGLQLSAASGVAVAAFSGDACFSVGRSARLEELHTRFYEPLCEPRARAEELLAGPPVQKLLFYADTAAQMDALVTQATPLFLDSAALVRSAPDMLEVLPPLASKGAGVRRLLEALGVSPGRAMAVGDGNNDVEMFAEVTLAVAVANATPRARAAAAHVLPVSNDEDAVAEAIYTHLLSDS